MSWIKEFKTFAMRGNVVDMAIGIIIGAAFGKVVSSMVNDVIMPPIGYLLGGVDFSQLALNIQKTAIGGTPVTWRYGQFIQTIVDFAIVAFAVFLLVKGINALKKREEAAPAAPAAPPADVALLTEIRDLLKERR